MALSQALSDELSRRPPKPRRGMKASLISGALNWPHLVKVLLQRVANFLQGIIDRGPFVIVNTSSDVREVTERDEDFPSGPVVGPALVCGAFVLGTDRSALRDFDLRLLWYVFYSEHEPLPGGAVGERISQPPNAALFRNITAKVEYIVADARSRENAELDLIQEVFRPICVGIVQQHLGVGPADEEWIKVLWGVLESLALRIILPDEVDLDNPEDPVSADLVWAMNTLKIAINEAIDAAIAKSGGNTVIERMYDALVGAAPDVSRAEIRGTIVRNIAGLATTACHPIVKAAAHAVDYLLFHEEALDGAVAAAKMADEELFWACILEALRFFPLFPLLTRACAHDTNIGGRKVRATQQVQVGMLTAMFDAKAWSSPNEFRSDRAPENSLVFGHGIHACFGFHFAREVLVAMLMPIFACGFVRAPGRSGKLRFDLLVPKSLAVTLAPQSS